MDLNFCSKPIAHNNENIEKQQRNNRSEIIDQEVTEFISKTSLKMRSIIVVY